MLLDILKRNLSKILFRRTLPKLPRTRRIDPERCRSILFRLILRNRFVELNRLLHNLAYLLMVCLGLRLKISLERLRLIRWSIVAERLNRRLNIMLRRHRRQHRLSRINLSGLIPRRTWPFLTASTLSIALPPAITSTTPRIVTRAITITTRRFISRRRARPTRTNRLARQGRAAIPSGQHNLSRRPRHNHILCNWLRRRLCRLTRLVARTILAQRFTRQNNRLYRRT